MRTCIYCREELGTEHFNKEHVIPLQFGTFENNQTLIHTVCRNCNAYFGNSLENALGAIVSKRFFACGTVRNYIAISSASRMAG
jgi:hypothetical protein